VAIYRLVTSGTIETLVLRRAESKLKLETLVINKGDFRRHRGSGGGATGTGAAAAAAAAVAQLDADELAAVLRRPHADAALGRERPIADDELASVLNRTTLMGLAGAGVSRGDGDGVGGGGEGVAADADGGVTSRVGFDVLQEVKVAF